MVNSVVQIVFLSIANVLFFYLLTLATKGLSLKSRWVVHASTIMYIVIYSVIVYYVLQSAYYTEGFFFQVSPERQKCLKEQVEPIPNRSCDCCAKGTTGGYPARLIAKDFISPQDGWNWTRVDAYGTDESITPPTQAC